MAQLRAADGRNADAEENLRAACDLLEALVKEYGGTAAYHSQLGQAYIERGRLARLKEDDTAAAGFFANAERALRRAVELSGENILDRKRLQEVQEERSK